MRNHEAERMRVITLSNIRTIFVLVDRLKAEGRKIISFHIGRPVFDTPHIEEVIKQALNRGLTAYTQL